MVAYGFMCGFYVMAFTIEGRLKTLHFKKKLTSAKWLIIVMVYLLAMGVMMYTLDN